MKNEPDAFGVFTYLCHADPLGPIYATFSRREPIAARNEAGHDHHPSVQGSQDCQEGTHGSRAPTRPAVNAFNHPERASQASRPTNETAEKISFALMALAIGERWRTCDDAGKSYHEQRANAQERARVEIKKYQREQSGKTCTLPSLRPMFPVPKTLETPPSSSTVSVTSMQHKVLPEEPMVLLNVEYPNFLLQHQQHQQRERPPFLLPKPIKEQPHRKAIEPEFKLLDDDSHVSGLTRDPEEEA